MENIQPVVMLEQVASTSTSEASGEARPHEGRSAPLSRWEVAALGLVLLVSLFLNLYHLGQDGYPNMYYAAAVKSMMENWHNFFFVSFDPGGYISVDKPPLAFWIQVGSAKLFGLSPLSVMLPQVLAGVLSVFLLGYLVRRTFGPLAGVLAAASLAVTPISVVTNRNSTMDSVLTLVLLLAAWAISVAVEQGKVRFLLLSAFVIGIGFNIKMLDAYLVVPAFALLYWFSAPFPPKKRLAHLGLAAVVMLVVSLCWAVTVDLIPATQRPFVGSSPTNSEVQLSLFYNGANRLSGNAKGIDLLPSPELVRLAATLPAFSNIETSIGTPGIFRLLTPPMSGQVGLLIPLAVLGLIGVKWDKPSFWPLNRQQQGLALWGVWFLTQFVFFTSATFMHQYYTTVMAPAICALVGIGVATTWHETTAPYRRWFLPVALLLSIGVQILQLLPYRTSELSLLFLCLVPVVLITAWLLRRSSRTFRRTLVLVCVCLLLVMPTAWAAIPVFEGRNEPMPYAGPDMIMSLDTSTGDLEMLLSQTTRKFVPDDTLVSYLLQQQRQTHYLALAPDSSIAAPIIVATGKPVMTTGGYSGLDQTLSIAQLQQLAATNVVHYVILPQTFSEAHAQLKPAYVALQRKYQALTNAAGEANQDVLTNWVRAHCTIVPESTWHASASETAPLLDLYDCSPSGT